MGKRNVDTSSIINWLYICNASFWFAFHFPVGVDSCCLAVFNIQTHLIQNAMTSAPGTIFLGFSHFPRGNGPDFGQFPRFFTGTQCHSHQRQRRWLVATDGQVQFVGADDSSGAQGQWYGPRDHQHPIFGSGSGWWDGTHGAHGTFPGWGWGV